jgi:hypothetical protein
MKGKSKFSGLGIALGAALGTVFGVIAGNMGVWLAIGVAIGVVLGASVRQKKPDCEHCTAFHPTREAIHRRLS